MKRLLLASAMALLTAGCAPEAVQRDLPPQFAAPSQLDFYKKLQERASTSDGKALRMQVAAANGHSGNPGDVSGPDTATGGSDTSHAPLPGSEADTPSAVGGTESTVPGEEPAPDQVNEGAQESEPTSDGQDQAPEQNDAPSETGSDKPKKGNPSCENSGGNANTCG